MFKLEDVRRVFDDLKEFDIDYLFVDKEFKLKKILLEDKFKAVLINSLVTRFLKLTNECEVVEYDPIIKSHGKLDSIEGFRVPKFSDIATKIYDIEGIDELNNLSDINTFKFYIIVLKKGDFKVSFFKKISANVYLKSKFKMFWNKGRLEELKEDIISIDDKFECVQYDSEFLVFSKSTFEQMFDYQDEYSRLCEDNIKGIESLNIIDNIELLREESEKITIKKKFSRIKEADIIWFKKHFDEQLEKILCIINNVGLDMEIVDNRLIVNDVSELIHLIQNDYLTSEIDGGRFVTEQKKLLI